MTRNRRALLLVALVALAGAAWLGLRVHTAATALSSARTSLEAARTHLLDRDLDAAQADLKRAAADTRRARAATTAPVWRATARLPLLGRSFRSVAVVAAAADLVTHRTLPVALDAARDLDPHRLRRADGSIDVALLRGVRPGVDEALGTSAGAYALARSAPSSLLLPYTGQARSKFLSAAQQLTAALLATRRGIDLAPVLLGDDHPRRYFVAVQQNAESRGTGGLIGGYAVLQASKGRLTVLQQGSDRDLVHDVRAVDRTTGLPTGFAQAYGAYSVYSSWQNINLPPQLPAVAKLIEAKWAARTGQHLDGVITLDGNALGDILRGTDPLRIGSHTVRPDDLAEYLAVGQYEGLPVNADATSRRKDSLEQVAATVLQRLTRTGKDSDLLLQGLVRAIQSGHLRIASDEPALAGLHRAGIDGALPTGSAPVAFASIFNAQGSKLDRWLHRSVRWSCGASGRATVRVELRTDLPKRALPPYTMHDLRQNPKLVLTRDDVVHLDLYVTKGASLVSATLDGLPVERLTHGVVGGLPFWGKDLELPEGRTRTFTLVLDDAGKGQVRMPEQPLALPLVTAGREGC